MADRVEICRTIERELFGDDGTANTDERIEDALSESFGVIAGGGQIELHFPESQNQEHDALCILKAPFATPLSRDRNGLPEVALTFWNNRHGEQWRDAIESVVSAWRAEPRNFFEDWDAWEKMVKAAMRADLFFYPEWFCSRGEYIFSCTVEPRDQNSGCCEQSDNLRESVVMAVYQSLPNGGKA